MAAVSISFSGKKVIITGGGKGLGRAMVERLYKGGADVYTLDIDETLVTALKTDFPKINALQCDVSNWGETQKTVESFGPVDYLVNNVAIIGAWEKFGSITEKGFDDTYAVNIKSAVNISQTVTNGMIAHNISGSVVNVASLTSRYPIEGSSVHGSAKAALINLTKCMALELSPFNIRVNAICPTFINTDMAKQVPELAKRWISRGLIKRAAEPDELVDLILFLLSPNAAMITGEEVFIDGGFSAH